MNTDKTKSIYGLSHRDTEAQRRSCDSRTGPSALRGAASVRRGLVTFQPLCLRASVAQIRAAFLILNYLFCLGGYAQTANLAWTPPASATTFRLGIGTNSGNYVLTQNIIGTNATLNLSALFAGTNYLAVAAWQDEGGTNALLSPWSNEILITRATAPALQLNISISTSTNLVVWTGNGPTATAITSADRQLQFFRPGGMTVTSSPLAAPKPGEGGSFSDPLQPPLPQ